MRPREKAWVEGIHALTNAELLALLIGSGTRGEQALDAASRVLRRWDGNLHALGRSSLIELRGFKGIGDARAVRIAASMELGKRRWAEEEAPPVRITRSADIVSRFRSRLLDRREEEFWVLALTRANTVIADLKVSQGGQSGTVVDPKVVFSRSLAVRAAAIVLVHNHPSGNPQPSQADRALTRAMSEVGKALDMPILDHVIIAGMGHFSFADHQLL